MPSVRSFNTLRARSYLVRIPLFTRAMILAIVGFWALGLVWDVRKWGALIPDKVGFATGELTVFSWTSRIWDRSLRCWVQHTVSIRSR